MPISTNPNTLHILGVTLETICRQTIVRRQIPHAYSFVLRPSHRFVASRCHDHTIDPIFMPREHRYLCTRALSSLLTQKQGGDRQVSPLFQLLPTCGPQMDCQSAALCERPIHVLFRQAYSSVKISSHDMFIVRCYGHTPHVAFVINDDIRRRLLPSWRFT